VRLPLLPPPIPPAPPHTRYTDPPKTPGQYNFVLGGSTGAMGYYPTQIYTHRQMYTPSNFVGYY